MTEDPVEQLLIEEAAVNSLKLLKRLKAGGVTKFVRSGETLYSIRVSVVDKSIQEAYTKEIGVTEKTVEEQQPSLGRPSSDFIYVDEVVEIQKEQP